MLVSMLLSVEHELLPKLNSQDYQREILKNVLHVNIYNFGIANARFIPGRDTTV
jgi:hypothetical protein